MSGARIPGSTSIVPAGAGTASDERRLSRVVVGSVALVGLLLFLLVGGTAFAHPSSFSDVASGSGAHEAVEYLAAAGIVAGYPGDVFKPDAAVTRGQSAKILAEQYGVEPADSGAPYTDLDDLYRPYVSAVSARGWVAGYPDGTFRPYAPLQRQHMAVIVVRALGLEARAQTLSAAEVAGVLSRFGDASHISVKSAPYVTLAVTEGLMKGDASGRFNPTDTTIRAHFAMVAYRAELRDAAVVENLRYSPDHLDKTRVVLDLSRGLEKLESKIEGTSLLVDMTGAIVEKGGLSESMTSPEIDGASVTQRFYRPRKVRAVIALDSFSSWKVYAIPPSDGLGHRVVIDVYRKVETHGAPFVAIDPGHGGSDPGAIGVTGVKEKDVNLAIGLELEAYLLRAGMVPLMTRDDDSYPTLQERVAMANAAKTDIFVSIHNNASSDSRSAGTETYYWGDEDDYSVEGMRLAESIQNAVIEELGSADRGARTHWKSLYVLGNTDMPAALVEVGFLTNAQEEAKLTDPAYQKRAAKAIAEGIARYFEWDYDFDRVG